MAQSGFTPIKLYLSTTPAAVPTAGNLEPGELALNNADGKLFYEDSAGVVQVLATKAGASGTVTSVDVSGGTTGLTTSGGPVTSSGTITLAGTLAATNGGTGQTSYAVGDLVFASTTTALSKLADVATGNALISGGVGVAPSYGKIGLTTHVSGTLPATNGGTGQSSYAVGDLVFASTTTALSKLADVATGNALISGGVGVAPAYGKIGLTTHVSGTLPTANGGTGNANGTVAKVATTSFSIEESGGKLVFKFGATTIASLSSAGVFTALSDVVSNGTP